MVENLAASSRTLPTSARLGAPPCSAALGRFPESAEAYEHLAEDRARTRSFSPTTRRRSAWYAQGRTLAGQPFELAREALAIDPAPQRRSPSPAQPPRWTRAISRRSPRVTGKPSPPSFSGQRRRRARARHRRRGACQGRGRRPAVARREDDRRRSLRASRIEVGVRNYDERRPGVAAKGEHGRRFVFARAELNNNPLPARELPLAFAGRHRQRCSHTAKLSGAGWLRTSRRASRAPGRHEPPQPGDLVGSDHRGEARRAPLTVADRGR